MMSSDYGGKNYRYSRTNCNKTSLEVSYDSKKRPADHHLSLHTDAIAMEKLAKKLLPQSADPVPRSISASCGLSWCADPSARPALEALLLSQDFHRKEFTNA